MININDKKRCVGCHACYNICPINCIRMVPDEEGFLYPVVDEDKCVDCHKCEQICPLIYLVSQPERKPSCFGVYAKDKTILENGSSGGIFYLLASQVIADGGVVVGAAFTGYDAVSHIFVDRIEDINRICKSKYTQSTIGDTYKITKMHLQNGRKVLFSGTPCQIGGLIKYLNRSFDDLILVDIVCHGVPSPGVLKEYIKYQENKHRSKIDTLIFRDKTYGWTKHSIRIDFANGEKYIRPSIEDAYMKAYLKNLTVRPACFECQFKSISRPSDITLADFWGVQKIAPDIKSERGTSLMLVHTERGETLFNSIICSVNYKTIKVEDAIEYNRSMIKRPTEPPKRDEFIRFVMANGFDEADRKYLQDSIVTKAKRKAGILLRSIRK